METCKKKFEEKPEQCPACGCEKFRSIVDYRFDPPTRWVCESCNYS